MSLLKAFTIKHGNNFYLFHAHADAPELLEEVSVQLECKSLVEKGVDMDELLKKAFDFVDTIDWQHEQVMQEKPI